MGANVKYCLIHFYKILILVSRCLKHVREEEFLKPLVVVLTVILKLNQSKVHKDWSTNS